MNPSGEDRSGTFATAMLRGAKGASGNQSSASSCSMSEESELEGNDQVEADEADEDKEAEELNENEDEDELDEQGDGEELAFGGAGELRVDCSDSSRSSMSTQAHHYLEITDDRLAAAEAEGEAEDVVSSDTLNQMPNVANRHRPDDSSQTMPQQKQLKQQLQHEQVNKKLSYEGVEQVELFGVRIVALTINSKERLCLAQISNTLLREFSYNEIHNRRVALGITCVQCTPIQLEMLRRAGAMPSSSRRCGMITMREAERLCRSFLVEEQPPELPENFYFTVAHRVNYGCKGRFVPARYISSRAKCIECFYCGEFYSPNKFIFHSHRQPNATDCNPPDSPNINSWRKHIDLDWTQEHNQEIKYAWEDVKSLFNGGTRRRAPNWAAGGAANSGGSGQVSNQQRRSALVGGTKTSGSTSLNCSAFETETCKMFCSNADEDQLIDVESPGCDATHPVASNTHLPGARQSREHAKQVAPHRAGQQTARQRSNRTGPGSGWTGSGQFASSTQIAKELAPEPGQRFLQHAAGSTANQRSTGSLMLAGQQVAEPLASGKRSSLAKFEQQTSSSKRFCNLNAPVTNANQVLDGQSVGNQQQRQEQEAQRSRRPTFVGHQVGVGCELAAGGVGLSSQMLANQSFDEQHYLAQTQSLQGLGANSRATSSSAGLIQAKAHSSSKGSPLVSYPNSSMLPNANNSPNHFLYSQLYTQLIQPQQQSSHQQQQHQLNSAMDAQALALRHHLWSSLLANLQCQTNNQTYNLAQVAPTSQLNCNQPQLIGSDPQVAPAVASNLNCSQATNLGHLISSQLYSQRNKLRAQSSSIDLASPYKSN